MALAAQPTVDPVTTLPLAGKVALVTGADTGPGAAIALELARHGARIAAQFLDSFAAAVRLVREIEQTGGRAVAIKADPTDPAQVELLCLKTGGTLGGIDLLVVTDAALLPAAPDGADAADQLGAAAARALGCLLPVYAALPRLVARGGGSLTYVPAGDDDDPVRSTVEGAIERLAERYGAAGIRLFDIDAVPALTR
jgi:3-oxoacyl-[acyl-carrier protein] reductase